jgi:hypothetical protein
LYALFIEADHRVVSHFSMLSFDSSLSKFLPTRNLFRCRNRWKSSLFLHLKRFLACKNFESDDQLKESIEKWLTSQAADFYEQGIQNLVPRYDKCLSEGGDYVKK